MLVMLDKFTRFEMMIKAFANIYKNLLCYIQTVLVLLLFLLYGLSQFM